jgi:hypothetical protein
MLGHECLPPAACSVVCKLPSLASYTIANLFAATLLLPMSHCTQALCVLLLVGCRLRCLDCQAMVDAWYVMDDGSNEDELTAMKQAAPDAIWLSKQANETGHVGSINALLKAVADYDYVVWLEDDWLFIRDESFVSKAITVLHADTRLGQVRELLCGWMSGGNEVSQPACSPMPECARTSCWTRSACDQIAPPPWSLNYTLHGFCAHLSASCTRWCTAHCLHRSGNKVCWWWPSAGLGPP